MVPPGPQLGAKVVDPLHARLGLDRSEELQRLDAELAGLIDLALVDTDRGLVGEIAGALLGRVRVERTDGLLQHSVGRVRLRQADVNLALEAGQPWAVVVVEPLGLFNYTGATENALDGLQGAQALGWFVRPGPWSSPPTPSGVHCAAGWPAAGAEVRRG